MKRQSPSNQLLLAAAGVGAFLGLQAVARNRRYFDLTGKVVVVTGGTRGLGLVMARQFAGRGARVAVCGRSEQELKTVREEFKKAGRPIVALACDVTDPQQVRSFITGVTGQLGPVDVLVNNAGMISVGPVEHMTVADYRLAMETHFWGPLHATLAVMPDMQRRRSGRIVNISSIGGKVPFPHLLPYAASKFALVGFSEGLRAELAKDNVWVTTVCPGLMRTGSPRNADFKGQHKLEYAWFNLSDSLPGSSMGAARAARQIIDAAVYGKSEIVLSLPAKAAALAHGIAPGLVSDLLGAANTFAMPRPGGVGEESRKGHESESPATRNVLTGLTRRAERAHNQLG